MPDHTPMDLAVFADDEGNSVRITVLGPEPSWSGGFAAEIIVETPFVNGRTDLILYDSKLQAWAEALDRLDAGEDIAWMEMSNGPSVFIRLAGDRDCPEVTVEDESHSMVTVRVPVVLPDGWIADHRERLRLLREGPRPRP
ncbi:DUF5959 family protein [Actinoplanes subglobosus]|uniref:DUF5959 family protein n=1 Tax=Actinoplanes subglobosus TaxID=1547892 RepID=A0ABV8IL19_9ACTN